MARVYIAGRMNGMPDLNFARFNRVAESLRAQGHEVLNPVEIGKAHFGDKVDGPQQDFLIKDILELLTCDTICLIEGWEEGTGAVCEAAIAKTMNYEFWYANFGAISKDGREELHLHMGIPPKSITVSRSYKKRNG
jgi:hypothetical protein